MNEEILTVALAAERLNMNERTIRDAISAGTLKGYRRGTQVFILFSDLVEYVKGGEDAKESKGKFKKEKAHDI